ncbi:hypothetical protein [Collimonas sp.]|jgi:hypothetical protein|uniref:hypothetical protein n=1 Tax=Collimonas sp. TaxID=1963772 RepID=UPI002C33152E|nr:hypothetical protein [Collimonas sp.]HWW04752.1 hypothetical protein [Collimonas sp.]
MFEKKLALLSVAVASILTACGGSDGTSTAVTPTTPAVTETAAGKAVDGYLSGASALCDTNNNGVADAGETAVTTDAQGNFTFAPACSSTIVVNGGSSIDTGLPFKGTLKAQAGSTVATPLTSLMVNGGMTAAQITSALGLPAGTDIRMTDPMSNADLHKKTLAMQQIIQQVTDTLGALAQDSSPATVQAIYSQVAKAVTTTLVADPTAKLIGGDNSVNASLVSGMVQQSVTNIAAASDTSLTAAKAGLGGFSASSVAVLISGAVAGQAQALTKAGDTDLLSLTQSLQADPTIANAASGVAVLLTTAVAGKVDLTTLGTALTVLSDSDSSNDAAASAAMSSAIAAQAQLAGVSAPAVAIGSWSQPTNFLAIQNDRIEFNGNPYTLKQFSSGVVLPAKPASTDTVSFTYKVIGSPIPRNAGGVMTSNVSLGVELADTGNSGLVLQVIVDQADLSLDGNKQLSVAIPAGAKMYVSAKTSGGTGANLTLTKISDIQFIEVVDNKLTVNTGIVLKHMLSQLQGQSSALLSNLKNLSGTFNTKFVVSNLNIRSETDKTAVKGLSVSIAGSGQPAVNGLGVLGILTIP